MSKINLTPNAGGTGTLTVTSPNTNTDYTLTLPSGTGTFNISGTPNEVPAGTVSAPSIYFSGDTNTGIYSPGSDTIAFTEGGVEAMRLDSSGNVGIGTTSPGYKLEVNGSTKISGNITLSDYSNIGATNNNAGISLTGGSATNNGGQINLRGGSFSGNANVIEFIGGGSERARIDSSGNLLVGTTTARGKITVSYNTNSSANPTVYFANDGGSGVFATFGETGGFVNGTITRSGSSTAYNTTSDYRLKENVQPMLEALATVAQLKPCTYTWKVNGSAGQGFIAHELQAVVPDCVSGEKDAIDADGNPIYQGVDTSFLVATLTAAIQELNAKVEAQAAEIAALKAQGTSNA